MKVIDDTLNLQSENYKETFRDRISTVDEKGKRKWIYPRKPSGKLHNYRLIVGYILFAFFATAPFIELNGNPMLMFNFLQRKFSLFFVIFHPQDSYIFLILMISLIVFIILFTVSFGRLWCGWACPQTIFLELIYRKIEYFIEGDAPKQKKLNSQPWNTEKILRKSIKFVLFYIVSFVLANIVLTYLIGATEWIFRVTHISSYIGTLMSVAIFAAVIFTIYALFREQVCIIVCPYGRLQGILVDTNTIIVAYDYLRGEPRRNKQANVEAKQGDCIDCEMCVDVCPTGIDIRNGTQLECVNCTACIDSCNSVMKKIHKPLGLIRFTSERKIRERESKSLNLRTIAYSVVLTALVVFLVFLLSQRTDVETTIIRTSGTFYQENSVGEISNLYNIKIVNKTNQEQHISIVLDKHEGRIEFVGNKPSVLPNSVNEAVFFLYLNKQQIESKTFVLKFKIYIGDKYVETVKTTFVAP